jgi:phosphatidylinositol 4-kinase
MPLIMMCLEGLGKLAEKFPMLAKQSSDCLREFLTYPSKILVRLNRTHPKKDNPQIMVTQSDR